MPVFSTCCGIVDVDGLIAIGVDDAFQLAGDGVDSLVPGNLLELSFAAFARTLHGVQQTVGAVEPASRWSGRVDEARACKSVSPVLSVSM